jgi:alkanesulfonate monooxygenase SsuD/methylene tetrahydromethanopterin reductase-like flavin-dependent oxidoreductase (luciferase family)
VTLEFGIGLGQDQNVHDVARYAKVAEDLGYRHATLIDMGTLGQEVTVMMTVAAMGTERIHIGHGVTNPATYHPGAIANAAASLRELTSDRAFVGIGAGGPYGQYLTKGVRMDELAEAIRFIKRYSAGEEGEWKGHAWHSEWIRRSHFAGRAVPVWLAIAGPRTCRMAGELADAALSIGMDPDLQGWRIEQIGRGAETAGRDPSEVAVWIRTQIYVAESKAVAKRELEPYAATCAWELYQILRQENPGVAELRARIEKRHPGLVEEFKRIYENWDPYWTERVGGPQTRYTTQRVIDFFLASGTPDQICEQIGSLAPLGIRGISSVMFSIRDDLAMLERMAREIHPRFR